MIDSAMAYFIPAVLVPFFILLLFFVHRKDLRDLIAGGENKCEECSYNVVSKLTRKKIEFLYKLSFYCCKYVLFYLGIVDVSSFW